MNRSALLSLVFLAAFLFSCSDDDDAVEIIQYHWPVWSPSGESILSGYEYFRGDPNGLRTPIREVAVKDASSEEERFLQAADGIDNARYWVLPGESIFATNAQGLQFYSLNGGLLGTYTTAVRGISPQFMSSRDDTSFYWGLVTGDNLVIGYAGYTSAPWMPTSEVVLHDTTLDASLLDLVALSSGRFAYRLNNGSVLVQHEDGSHVRTLLNISSRSDHPMNERLVYFKQDVSEYLYYLTPQGLSRAMIETGSTSVLTAGGKDEIIAFDANAVTNKALFVSGSGEVWLTSPDGIPVQRLLSEHAMASFSPDGTTIAAVTHSNRYTSSLTIYKFGI
ncbi:MAG: hypothetical protein CL946_03500 [Ectothiorhodospiraceae bacterium]|nr:hypothetical protein [Ectothiorhodospiraceae bacterium]